MKAIRIHDFGSVEQLKYEETPIPEINSNQVLVKVYATTVNHLDMLKASGKMNAVMPIQLPWIPGHDFAGIIEKVGSNVKEFKPGDAVYGNCNGGSYAEYVVADLDKITIKPAKLSFVESSAVPHVGETAWQAIHTHGQLKPGQKVLIHGAAGAVGAFAVQFAHNLGAVVYATAATEDMELVKSLGADKVIDYKTQDFTKEFSNVDLVLALVGGNTEEKSYSIIKNGGRLVSTVGIMHGDIAKQKNIEAIGMVIKQSASDLREITRLIDSGKVKTDIAVVYPLSEAAKGWKNLLGDASLPRITHGKIVLEVVK